MSGEPFGAGDASKTALKRAPFPLQLGWMPFSWVLLMTQSPLWGLAPLVMLRRKFRHAVLPRQHPVFRCEGADGFRSEPRGWAKLLNVRWTWDGQSSKKTKVVGQSVGPNIWPMHSGYSKTSGFAMNKNQYWTQESQYLHCSRFRIPSQTIQAETAWRCYRMSPVMVGKTCPHKAIISQFISRWPVYSHLFAGFSVSFQGSLWAGAWPAQSPRDAPRGGLVGIHLAAGLSFYSILSHELAVHESGELPSLWVGGFSPEFKTTTSWWALFTNGGGILGVVGPATTGLGEVRQAQMCAAALMPQMRAKATWDFGFLGSGTIEPTMGTGHWEIMASYKQTIFGMEWAS